MDELENYKEHIRRHSWDELKEQVLQIAAQKGLASVMNDTKWIELKKAVATLPFPPPYIVKCITEEDCRATEQFDKVPRYIGDWSYYYEEGMPPFFTIEWIKVLPKYGKYRGRLIADEIIDETPELIAILQKYNIPYYEENGIFTIYGYK